MKIMFILLLLVSCDIRNKELIQDIIKDKAPTQDIFKLSAENLTTNSLTLKWEDISIFDEYDIYQDDTLINTTTNNSIYIDSLIAQREYEFYIVGKNNTTSEESETITIILDASDYYLYFQQDHAMNLEQVPELDLLPSQDYTISLWFKFIDDGVLISKADSNDTQYEIYMSQSIIRPNVGNSSNTVSHSLDNNWHHLALVNKDSQVILYLDGVDQNINISSGSGLSNVDSLLGAKRYQLNTGLRDSFNGSLDEVAIFEKALIEEEIQSIYNNGFDNSLESNFDNYSSATFLIAYFKMGDNTNVSINSLEDSINQIPMTPINMTDDNIILK